MSQFANCYGNAIEFWTLFYGYIYNLPPKLTTRALPAQYFLELSASGVHSLATPMV